MTVDKITTSEDPSTTEPSAGIVDVSGLTAAEIESFVEDRPSENVGIHRRGARTFVVVD